MTANPNEGNPTPTSEETPNSALEGAGGQPLGNEALVSLQSTLETLTKRFGELESNLRGMQGDKDRGVKRVEQEVGDLRARIDEILTFREKGMDADDIEFRMNVNELSRRLGQISSPAQPSAGTAASEAGTEALSIVRKLELDPTDPEITRLLQSTGDLGLLASELAGLKVKKLSQPAPSPAASPPLPSSGAGKPEAVDDLIAKYKVAVATNPLSKEAKALKKELDALGWGI